MFKKSAETERNMDRRSLLVGSAATLAGIATVAAISEASAAETAAAPKHDAKRPATGHRAFTVENTALVLVDHQVGTIGWAGELSGPQERDDLKMWTRVIARFGKAAGIPIVLTSSLETEQQGPLLPEFEQIMPAEFAARIKRNGVINAWDDPAFAKAVRATGKKNILMGGLTTDVCLVPPALSAKAEGLNVTALLDISAACSRTGAQNSRDLLKDAAIDMMTVTPMITSILGNYKSPASGAFFETMAKEGVYQAFGRGNLR